MVQKGFARCKIILYLHGQWVTKPKPKQFSLYAPNRRRGLWIKTNAHRYCAKS
jgi:hypothetical protein